MTSMHLTRPVRRTAPTSSRLRGYATASLPVDPEGHLYDEYAQALALDAQAAVERGVPWNAPSTMAMSVYESRVHLSSQGIDSTTDWVAALGRSLHPEQMDDVDLVLRFRAELMRRGETVTGDRWRGDLHEWLTDTEQDDDAHRAADQIVDGALELDRLVEDVGILPAGIRVRSAAAYRISHAVSIVRWGACSGYGDSEAVQQALLAARDTAGTEFSDWNEYAASLLYGTVLHPNTDVAAAFDDHLPAVASLLTRPDSPWMTLEFPLTVDFDIPDDPSGL